MAHACWLASNAPATSIRGLGTGVRARQGSHVPGSPGCLADRGWVHHALILDTGPTCASLDRDDADHGPCRALIEASDEPLIVPAPALVEVACWVHARLHPGVLVALLEDIDAGAYAEEALVAEDYRRSARSATAATTGEGMLRCRRMATEIPQRELRNNTADVLRRVERGERLRITVHGHPVADLVPTNRPAEFVPFAEVRAGLARLLGAEDGLDRELRDGLLTGEAVDPFARYEEITGRARE